jgi:hypothetical protein
MASSFPFVSFGEKLVFREKFPDWSAKRTTVNPTIAMGDALENDPGRSEGADPKGAIIRR